MYYLFLYFISALFQFKFLIVLVNSINPTSYRFQDWFILVKNGLYMAFKWWLLKMSRDPTTLYGHLGN